MKLSSTFAVTAAALLFAADEKAASSPKPKATTALVDINSASKQDLAKLPGITPADVDKIIAGRPYGSKAHLQTRQVISPDTYQLISSKVIARQPTKDAGKNAELQKKK